MPTEEDQGVATISDRMSASEQVPRLDRMPLISEDVKDGEEK